MHVLITDRTVPISGILWTERHREDIPRQEAGQVHSGKSCCFI